MVSFSIYLVIFKATNANQAATGSFQSHRYLEERNITFSQM